MSNLPVRMAHHYPEDVRLGLKAAGLFVSQEWFETQAKRVELHRQMGLTPPQSVEELRPFAEGARKSRVSGPGGLRALRQFCADRVREMREQAGGRLPGDPA